MSKHLRATGSVERGSAASIGETIIDGYVKTGTDQVNLQPCNPLFPPLRLLKLTTYEWQSTYDPADNASFESHSAVSNIIGGGCLSQSAAASSSSSSSSSSTKAIIGGVIGNVADIALGAAATYFFVYRPSKRKQGEVSAGGKPPLQPTDVPPAEPYRQEEDDGRRIHEADAGALARGSR